MAWTVNSAFEEFNKNYVNLVKGNASKGRDSRDWLIGQLNSLPQKVLAFPSLYEERHIKFGSFARNTKIKPLDDIDLILVFEGCGATYSSIPLSTNRYAIHTDTSAQELINLSDYGVLSSIKLINKLVSGLKEVEQYKAADIHRRKEAATLKLRSYEWNFDIVPAFYTVKGFYLIPDAEGGWKATDPRIDQSRATTINQKHDGKVLQIIRTLKFWNRRASMPSLSSYLFENLILNYFERKTEIPDFIDINMIRFWEYMESAVWSSVIDPKGFQGDLNNLSLSDKLSISDKALRTREKALEANHLETSLSDQKRAIKKWREIFGDDFPEYG